MHVSSGASDGIHLYVCVHNGWWLQGALRWSTGMHCALTAQIKKPQSCAECTGGTRTAAIGCSVLHCMQTLQRSLQRKEKSDCVHPTQSLDITQACETPVLQKPQKPKPKDLCENRPTRKRASTSLKRVLSMSTPATAVLLTMLRLLHTAHACFKTLLQRSAFCCSDWKLPFSTGIKPWRSACSHASHIHSKA